jgi:NADH:ubiquinone oxidoreductase subunit 2 (subunit N)
LIIAVIMTIVSFYYYLRVVVTMLAAPDEALAKPARVGISTGTVLGATALATIVLGIIPSVVLDWATHAASLHF